MKYATFFFILGVLFCASTHGLHPKPAQPLEIPPQNAKMPQQFLQKELGDLKIGESCYTMPWAMWIDLEGRCWLNPRYPVDEKPRGTVKMYVFRKQAGYYVNIWNCKDHGWQRVKQPSFVGQSGPWIPVVQLLSR